MKICISLFFALLLFYGQLALAKDAFDNVKCGGDIPAALIGKYDSNGTVVKIEAKHKDLGLKDLGADEISDALNSINWMICGNEFMLLEDKKDLIHDVLPVPDHSKHALTFTGKCKINDKEKPELIFAILKDEDGKKLLSPSAAWIINEKKKVFEKVSIEGMMCPRE
jgi:hypothetical protein